MAYAGPSLSDLEGASRYKRRPAEQAGGAGIRPPQGSSGEQTATAQSPLTLTLFGQMQIEAKERAVTERHGRGQGSEGFSVWNAAIV
jgi:hypothetical protein